MASRGRPFKKGQSGNPAGRPKAHSEFIEKIRAENAEQAREMLSKAAKSGESWAVQLVLAYAWGKPSEAKFDLTQVRDEELTAEILRRRPQRATLGQDAAADGEQH